MPFAPTPCERIFKTTTVLTSFDGNTFAVTPKGRPFVRVAATFDRHLKQGQAKHCVAV
ncbi:MAG: hypothetical protein AAAB20_31895 [Rhizobium sp.]|uniref:hypothetical protein n=1 Tax=Rhizobium sp. TaxID=391 RepID=UPI0012E01E4C